MRITVNENPQYVDSPIPEFRGNPLIEALDPPPKNNSEAALRMIRLPKFNEKERDLPTAYRICLTKRLRRMFIPDTKRIGFLYSVISQVLDGYQARNPMTAAGQRLLHNVGRPDYKKESISKPVYRAPTISFITGLSGMGKTSLVEAVMEIFGAQVIRHSNYMGKPLTETQILYLLRNIPDQCRPKPLCKSYGDYVDELLGVNLYAPMFSDNTNTRTHYLASLRRIIANHHVGILVLDQFQNLSMLKSEESITELVSLIMNLCEMIGIPIILVGTYRSVAILRKDQSMANRLTEENFLDLERFDCESDAWWNICKAVWQCQWVRNPVPFSDDICKFLYRCSLGIPGLMIKLVIQAQREAMLQETETVNENTLKSVYDCDFKPLHDILNAIASGKTQFMNMYDDLYLKFNPQPTKTSAIGNRLDKLLEDFENWQDNDLQIEDNQHNKKDKKSPNNQLSTDEMLERISKDCPEASEALGI